MSDQDDLDEIFLSFAKRIEALPRGQTYDWKNEKATVLRVAQQQTEAVLTDLRNWIDRNHYQPVNESDRWVQASSEIMIHIDTEIERLRKQVGKENIDD